jgi:xanthine dehydrogenase YagT iron-sulfur-binding subunit
MSDDQREPPETTPLATLSRRSFLSKAGAASATPLVLSSMATLAQTEIPADRGEPAIPGTVPVTLRINSEIHSLQIDPRATLLDTLRETLHLTGTKKGCDHGQCGACTVHIDGRRAYSCLAFAAMHQRSDITTIEGLGQPGNLHPMQAAFVEQDGFQCGYCTPGQIMSAVAMLKEGWGSSDTEVREAMSGNICRCGAYPNILAAVKSVRDNVRDKA